MDWYKKKMRFVIFWIFKIKKGNLWNEIKNKLIGLSKRLVLSKRTENIW